MLEAVDSRFVRHWALGGGPGIMTLASSQSAWDWSCHAWWLLYVPAITDRNQSWKHPVYGLRVAGIHIWRFEPNLFKNKTNQMKQLLAITWGLFISFLVDSRSFWSPRLRLYLVVINIVQNKMKCRSWGPLGFRTSAKVPEILGLLFWSSSFFGKVTPYFSDSGYTSGEWLSVLESVRCAWRAC